MVTINCFVEGETGLPEPENGEQPTEAQQYAKRLAEQYRALIDNGFHAAQAWEILEQMLRRGQI